MFSLKINNVDYSNWLIRDTMVPVVNRNRDFTPIASELILSLSELTNHVSEGDDVTVQEYNSSYPFYWGTVSRVKRIHDTRAYDVTVQHKINKLQKNFVTHNDLHAYFVDTNDLKKYNPIGIGTGYATVQLIHLLSCLGEASGFIFETSGLDVKNENNFIEEITWSSANHKIYINDLYVSEDMLWCVNNNVATKKGNIELKSDYKSNVLNTFDLFQEICSNLGLAVYLSQTGSPKRIMLFRATEAVYSPSEDLTFSKVTTKREPTPGGYSYKVNFNDEISTYKSDTEHDLEEIEDVSIDEGKATLTTIKNLAYLYQKPNSDDGDTLGISDFAPSIGWSSKQGEKFIYPFEGNELSMLRNKRNSSISEHAITDIRCPYNHGALNSLSHFVDTNKLSKKSIIKYEVAV